MASAFKRGGDRLATGAVTRSYPAGSGNGWRPFTIKFLNGERVMELIRSSRVWVGARYAWGGDRAQLID